MKIETLFYAFSIGIVLLLISCGGQPAPEVAPELEEIFFYADQTNIESGQCTFLRWEILEGLGASLNGEDVPLASEEEICPSESRVYELVVDMGDHVETRTIEISVSSDSTESVVEEPETATPSQPEQEQESNTPRGPAYQADSWVRLGGPPGGLGYDIRMNPRDPDVMFVTASPGGIFKSVDGGQTWVAKNQGLEKYPGSGADIFCATIDPHNPDHVWIGTQFTGHVYRSTDGGETWHERDDGITQMAGENSIRGITIDPNTPDIVYVGMERGTGIGGVTGEVYKSTDGGGSFTMIWQGENLARYIWVDPNNSQRLFVSTGIFDRDAANSDPDNMVCGGVGILRSDDGGATWTVLDEGNGLGGTYIPSLYMHPTNSDILLAAVIAKDYCPNAQPGVYVTRDGGDTWTLSLPGPIEAVEINETDPQVWYAAANGIFWRSDDSGQTWQEYPLRTAYRSSGTPIDLQADPRDPLRIFDNNYEGGNFLSEDGGATWVDASSGYSGARVGGMAVTPGDGSKVLVGAESSTFRSSNSGVNWIGTGIEGPAPAILRYTTAEGNTSLIASGPRGDHRVYLSSDGGESWKAHDVTTSQALQVPGFMMARALVVAPSYPQVMYLGYGGGPCLGADWPFCVEPSPGFFRSKDGGHTWEQVTGTPFDGASILNAAVPVDDAKTVYLTTMKGLFVTRDGSDSWQALTSLEAQVPWREMGVVRVPPALEVVADPFDGQTLYVGTQGLGLWLSLDSGVSWTQASAGMDPNEFILDILPDPNRSGVIYAATEQSGVYVSTDGASTWQKLNQGLDFRAIKVLALSEAGSVLYAGSGGAGVFRLGNPGEVIVSSSEETSSQTELVETEPPKPETGQVTVERDLKYGTYNLNGQEKSLLLDLYLPAGNTPSPVLLFIHGGGWWEGSKDDCPGETFAQYGYAVACVNYRLAKSPQGCSTDLTFPAQIHDVKAAVRWLRLNADVYGLDPDHFGVLGDSSGGHLAALLGVTSGVETLQGTQNLGASDDVQAVVDWFGPVDITQGPVVFTDDPCTTDWGYLNDTYGGEETPFFYWTLSWAYFLGDGLAEDDTLVKAQQATPLTHIDAEDPPFLVIHGEADGMVPITQSELLVDALRVAGVEVTFVRLPMIGHGYFPPDGRQYVMSEFLQPTLNFFDQYLKNE